MLSKHGGELDKISRKYNINRDKIIDFSANINPMGISEAVKQSIVSNVEKISTYPDIEYYDLKKSISAYVGININSIIQGNGATDIISSFIRAIKPKSSLIISPAYSEYEKEIIKTGGACSYFTLKEEEDFILDEKKLINIIDEYDFLVMCNPNNPTGMAVSNTTIEFITQHCLKRNILVMIDETYIEFCDESKYSSVLLTEKYDNLFIVRGTSKFFACPGLRLGYGITSNYEILRKINSVREPWNVNILSAIAGEVMFGDVEYINNSKNHIEQERLRFINELSKIENLKFYYPSANFILIKILEGIINSKSLFEKLILKGLLIRDCSTYDFLGDKFFRCCFLNKNDNNLLISEIKEIFSKSL